MMMGPSTTSAMGKVMLPKAARLIFWSAIPATK